MTSNSLNFLGVRAILSVPLLNITISFSLLLSLILSLGIVNSFYSIAIYIKHN